MTTKITDVQLRDAIGNSNGSYAAAAKVLGIPKSTLYDHINKDADMKRYRQEVKDLQKRRDVANTNRRQARKNNRVENLVETLESEMIKLLKDNKIKPGKTEHIPRNGNSLGIIALNDLHINEVINLPNNKFNLEIASRAIHKHVRMCLREFKAYDVSKVLFTFLGDLVNSDRRMDEALTNATNRSKAMLVAAQVLSSAIADVSQYYPVMVASVVGNESRVNKDLGFVDAIASDSYDLAIHRIMENMFDGNDRVEFLPMDDSLECVIECAGRHILLHHGHTAKGGLLNDTTKRISRYAAQGINLDLVLSGHIHESCIADIYARGGGLPGANAYSEKGLNLRSRRSQNSYILEEGQTGWHGFKHDLQDVGDFEPYPFNESLDSENSMYDQVDRQGTTVFKIVI